MITIYSSVKWIFFKIYFDEILLEFNSYAIRFALYKKAPPGWTVHIFNVR